MERITELFNIYKDNITWIRKIESKLQENLPIDEWCQGLPEINREYKIRYDQNDGIVEEIMEMISGELSDEVCDKLYFECKKMYEEYIDDGFFLVKIFEKLILHYEKIGDIGKAIISLSYASYEINDIIRRQYNIRKRNNDLSFKIVSYKDQYTKIQDEQARLRIWIEYYGIIVVSMDDKTISIEECFKQYDDMLELWNREDVQQLDGDRLDINAVINMINQRILLSEVYMDEQSDSIKERFCDMAIERYEEEIARCGDIYSIDPIIYIAYLRTQILKKQKTLDENFEKLYLFFREKLDRYDEKEQQIKNTDKDILYDDGSGINGINDGLFELVRNISSLKKWIAQGVNKDIAERVLSDILTTVESKWHKLEYVSKINLDELMWDLVDTYIDMPFDTKVKERFMYEFGIKRQLLTHVNSYVVKNISLCIASELLESNPKLFDDLGMDSISIKEYIEKAAVFHDFGNLGYYIYKQPLIRSFFKEEINYLRGSFANGAKKLKAVEDLKCYHDVMHFHHIWYDGSTLDKYGLSCLKSEFLNSKYKIVIDIIAIADYIDTCNNILSNPRYYSKSFDETIENLNKLKGTRFNPVIVDKMNSSNYLISKIGYIIGDGKWQFMYSRYHSFQLGETQNEKIGRVEKLISGILNSESAGDADKYKDEIEYLFTEARSIDSEEFIGLVYCASMEFYLKKKEFINTINAATNVLIYLNRTKRYEYIGSCLNCLGLCNSMAGDFGLALSNYLQCYEAAKLTGHVGFEHIVLYNISSVFEELHNYEKALEYILKIEYEKIVNPTMKELYLSYMIYYLLKLERTEEAFGYYENLDEFISEYEDKEGMDLQISYVAKAYIECKNNNYEKAVKFIEKAKNNIMPLEEYQYCVSEFDVYFEVLYEMEMYEELCRLLGDLIQTGKDNNFTYHIMQSLIRCAIKCARKLNNNSLIDYYKDEMDKIYQKDFEDKQQILLNVEKNSIDNIRYREKCENLLNDNNKLKEEIKKATDANNAKDTFLASVSHELRTPIHAILGLNEMIIRSTKEEKTKNRSQEIEKAGKSLLGIVNDILDYSNLEAGKVEIASEEYNIKDMVRELINQTESNADNKELEFVVKMNSSIPSRLYGDDLRIKQVITKILSNAFKFTNKGSVVFSIDYRKINEFEIELLVTISDTGIGMKPDEINMLNKAFVRVDENKTIQGVGLGISIATNLLNQMGSRLSVESTYGMGSSFSFKIRQKVSSWDEVGLLNVKNGIKQKSKRHPLFTASKVKVLIVDDMQVNLLVLKGLLKRTKVQVVTAKSGKDCLKLCDKEAFNIILMDHRMPEMDGVETLHHLRENGINKDVPVIAVTANVISGAYEYYTREGFDDLILKPVNVDFLEEKLMQYIPKELLD